MANYIAQCITPKVASEHIAKVTAPVGGLVPGQLVVADTLDNTIAGNIEVYTASAISAQNLGSEMVAVVLNDGFETLADGRRPAGQPNYYQYTFQAGETAPIMFLDRHLVFNIGADCIVGGTATVGQFLYATADSTQFTAGSAIPEGTATGLKVLAEYQTPIGGQFGGGFAKSYICVAQ